MTPHTVAFLNTHMAATRFLHRRQRYPEKQSSVDVIWPLSVDDFSRMHLSRLGTRKPWFASVFRPSPLRSYELNSATLADIVEDDEHLVDTILQVGILLLRPEGQIVWEDRGDDPHAEDDMLLDSVQANDVEMQDACGPTSTLALHSRTSKRGRSEEPDDTSASLRRTKRRRLTASM